MAVLCVSAVSAFESMGGSVGLLDGRVAIVTGASKGIGRVMSQMFAR